MYCVEYDGCQCIRDFWGCMSPITRAMDIAVTIRQLAGSSDFWCIQLQVQSAASWLFRDLFAGLRYLQDKRIHRLRFDSDIL